MQALEICFITKPDGTRINPANNQRLLHSSSAFQGRGPSTVLTVNVLAHREVAQPVRIDSRTRIPLFIAEAIHVNEKQTSDGIFMKKIFVRSVSETNGKTKPPRHHCRGGSERHENAN
jgi:hypothetical protein